MKRIFVISEYVDPNENTTGYYWHGIICDLAQKFESIYLICPNTNRYRKVTATNRTGDTSPEKTSSTIYGELKNMVILPLKVSETRGNGNISRLLKQIKMTFALLSIFVSNIRRGDVVLCGTNPALLILAMSIIKFFIAFKWILLIHDVFPENLIPAKIVKEKNIIYLVAKIIFDFSYGAATLSIAIGRDMKDLVEKKTRSRGRIVCIQNWVDPGAVFPIPREDSEIIRRLGWEKKIVFQFFGNLGRLQGINNLLSAIGQVTNKDAAFLFVGDGEMAWAVKSFIAARPEVALVYLGAVALNDKNDMLSSCDISLVTLEEGMLGLGVPSKSYFSLAADKPLIVVADAKSEVSRMVAEDEVGWCCEPGNPTRLALIIDQVCLLNLSEWRGRQRNLILTKYTNDISVAKISECVLAEYV